MSASPQPITFGTDGWRGVIAEDFTFANVDKVTCAIAQYLDATYPRSCPVLIGYDTRFLAQEFAERAGEILVALGWTVQICRSRLSHAGNRLQCPPPQYGGGTHVYGQPQPRPLLRH